MTLYFLSLQAFSVAHFAAEAPGTGVLRLLLERGIELDVRDKDGCHPIHWAAMKGQLENLKLLVEEAGVDPALTDNEVNLAFRASPLCFIQESNPALPIWLQGCNPLYNACWNFHADVAEYLLNQPRIDPLAKDEDGNHALMATIRPLQEDETPDQGLPILELIHRKAPKALGLPTDVEGKQAHSVGAVSR